MDHLDVSYEKYKTSVVDYFVQQEDSTFSPLAKRAE